MTTNTTITAELLDQLLANYEKPEDLTGDDGLFKQLKKALIERACRGCGIYVASSAASGLSRSPAAPAHCSCGAHVVPVLRWHQAVEDRRGRDRDPRCRAAAMVRDRACAGEVQLPVLRDDHAAAGAVSCDRARLCGAEPAGDDAGREIRQSSAAQSAE